MPPEGYVSKKKRLVWKRAMERHPFHASIERLAYDITPQGTTYREVKQWIKEHPEIEKIKAGLGSQMGLVDTYNEEWNEKVQTILGDIRSSEGEKQMEHIARLAKELAFKHDNHQDLYDEVKKLSGVSKYRIVKSLDSGDKEVISDRLKKERYDPNVKLVRRGYQAH